MGSCCHQKACPSVCCVLRGNDHGRIMLGAHAEASYRLSRLLSHAWQVCVCVMHGNIRPIVWLVLEGGGYPWLDAKLAV